MMADFMQFKIQYDNCTSVCDILQVQDMPFAILYDIMQVRDMLFYVLCDVIQV